MIINLLSNIVASACESARRVVGAMADWQFYHLPETTEYLLKRIDKDELERADLVASIEFREEVKANGWKNSRRSVQVDEMELENYKYALYLLDQGKRPFNNFVVRISLLVGVGGILGVCIADGIRLLIH